METTTLKHSNDLSLHFFLRKSRTNSTQYIVVVCTISKADEYSFRTNRTYLPTRLSCTDIHTFAKRLCSKEMVDPTEIISPIFEEYFEEVIQHLRNNFFADEPLNKAVKLCDQGEKHDDLEQHSLQTLRDNLSVMAVDKTTKKIIGVALNGIQRPDDVKAEKEKLLQAKDHKYKNIFSFLYGINQDLDLFAKYRVDSIFECRILSVDQNYRGQGLAKRLLERSLEISKNSGYKLFKQDATSFYTQKIADNMGFKTVFELRYKSYRGDDGEPIFKTSEPHKFLKVMVKLFE